MAQIVGIENLSVEQLNAELQQGAKFVIFQYCISVVVLSFKRSSAIHFIRPGQSTFDKSAGFTLLTVLLGWWGIPWGPIYSISALYNNFKGGKDITNEVVKVLNS